VSFIYTGGDAFIEGLIESKIEEGALSVEAFGLALSEDLG